MTMKQSDAFLSGIGSTMGKSFTIIPESFHPGNPDKDKHRYVRYLTIVTYPAIRFRPFLGSIT